MSSSTPDALWASRSVRLLRPAAVEIHGLRRRVRGRPVLAGLDLSVPVGARLLLVSEPEPAASLLLRILAGLVRPRGGRFRMAGVSRGDTSGAGWARRVAYVGPEADIYPWLSPREILELCARLAELEPDEARRRVEGALDAFGLRAAAQRPSRRGGPAVMQTTALAAALLSDPEVLLLDEPLRSVDPERRQELLRIGGRVTLLLASRYPAAEAGIVDQVALIRDGRLALHASLRDLVARRLPLSGRGIRILAELRAGEPAVLSSRTSPPAAASG